MGTSKNVQTEWFFFMLRKRIEQPLQEEGTFWATQLIAVALDWRTTLDTLLYVMESEEVSPNWIVQDGTPHCIPWEARARNKANAGCIQLFLIFNARKSKIHCLACWISLWQSKYSCLSFQGPLPIKNCKVSRDALTLAQDMTFAFSLWTSFSLFTEWNHIFVHMLSKDDQLLSYVFS